MKVLMINTVCGTGSTGRICTDIATGLIANGDDCLICYGRDEAFGFDNTYKIGSKLSFYAHALKTRIFDRHGLGSKRDTKRLVSRIKEYNPDIIHLHNIHGYYINYKILFEFLAKYNKPIVWTLHDCWAFTGHCAYFDYTGCDKWKTGCEKCKSKKEYPLSKLFCSAEKNYRLKKQSFTLPKNMLIVTPSEWLKNLAGQSFLKKYPIEVINNGIDLNVFKPTESDIKTRLNIAGKFIILAVANIWEKRKGIDDILKLADMLGDNEVIVLVGKTLDKTAHEKMIHVERTNNARELAALYSAANVVINPTYEDNYPTVNLEAQACGTPVITYATGGSVESVSVENVVPKGDIGAMYNALITNKDLCNKNFDKKTMMNNYVGLYCDI